MKTIGEVFPPPAGRGIARNKLVNGVGRNDWSGPVKQDGKIWYVYNTWANMLERAYSPKLHARQPTYVGCSVCAEWLSFSTFAQWLMAQPYFPGCQLDKDLLVLRNKVYCPERCLMVPAYVNSLTTDHGAARGEFPIGVDKRKGRYRARVRLGNGKQKFLGYFDTPEEAAAAARKAKLAYVESRRDEIDSICYGLYDCVVAKIESIYTHGC